MTEPIVLSEFTCKECGTECKVMKRDKDMWIEPKENSDGKSVR